MRANAVHPTINPARTVTGVLYREYGEARGEGKQRGGCAAPAGRSRPRKRRPHDMPISLRGLGLCVMMQAYFCRSVPFPVRSKIYLTPPALRTCPERVQWTVFCLRRARVFPATRDQLQYAPFSRSRTQATASRMARDFNRARESERELLTGRERVCVTGPVSGHTNRRTHTVPCHCHCLRANRFHCQRCVYVATRRRF